MGRLGRFLLVTWSGGGNVPPALMLARMLRDRGHDVRVLAGDDLERRVESAGIPFRAYRSEEAWRAGLATDVTDESQRVPTDVAIVDYMQPAAMCGAEAAGCAVVPLVHTLYTSVAMSDTSPMHMATSDDAMAALRVDLGLPEIGRLTDLLLRSPRARVHDARVRRGARRRSGECSLCRSDRRGCRRRRGLVASRPR